MNKQVLLMTLAVLISFGVGGCQTTSEQSASSSGDQSGLRSAGTQEQRDSEQRMRQQNLEERQRVEGSSTREHSATEIPPYSENQPIGGQKQAGAADFPQPAFPFVKGELVQIEGEYYILRDAEGKNVRVHVDKRTQMEPNLRIGDTVDVQRTLPGHALSMRRASEPLAPSASSASAGVGAGSGDRLVKDSQVTLGGAKQVVRGEVLQIDGDKYLIRDGHGNEVRLAVNQNTRMSCGTDKGSVSTLAPVPSASDKPDAAGQPQDLSRTAEQQGSEVGPGTRRAGNVTGAMGQCFNKGELIEAEISDMGVATFMKQAGRRQPGQALP
jgi:uncharacterized protein YdeI (BOF family)